MGSEDEKAYDTLCRYVDSFHPARWATREGEDVLDEEGYPTFEARPIDTKALVECQSFGQAARLLGRLLLEFACHLFAYLLDTNPVFYLCRFDGRATGETLEAVL